MPSAVIGEADILAARRFDLAAGRFNHADSRLNLAGSRFNLADRAFALVREYKPHHLLFTPDGTRILHGSTYSYGYATIQVWNLSLRELIKIPTADVSQVRDWARLLNDHIIVSGTLKGSYDFWDVTSGT